MRREERKRSKHFFLCMTKIPARALSVLLICVLLAGTAGVRVHAREAGAEPEEDGYAGGEEAAKKEEVVYGSLSRCGEVKSLYVVNSFLMPEAGIIRDHGNYSKVENLTDLTPIKDEDGVVSADVKKGRFYYQGELKKKKFPWLIDISYTLNGKEKDPDTMGGASGRVGITVRTSKNPEADPVFYEKYVLVVSVTLDTYVCSHIRAKGAMATNAGSDKMLNFISMPEKESEFKIKFRTDNFSMKGMTFAAMPASLDKDLLDFEQIGEMTEGLTKLSEGISTLSGGADSLDEGLRDFSDGAGQLSDGFSYLNSGIERLSDGAGQLSDGAAQLKDGSSQFKAGLDRLNEGSDELAAGSAQINDVFQGLKKMADMLGGVDTGSLQKLRDGLKALCGKISEASKTFSCLVGKIRDSFNFAGFEHISKEESAQALAELTKLAAEGKISKSTLSVYKRLMGNYLIAASADVILNCSGQLQQWSDDLAACLNEQIESIGNFDIAKPEELLSISGMIGTFADQFQTFHNGIVQYTGGVKALAENYDEIDKGIQGLSEGTAGISAGLKETKDGSGRMMEGVNGIAGGAGRLSGGMSDLASGIRQLNEQTSDMPGDVQEGIDDMFGKFSDPDFKPPSFVSPKNGRIEAVQFVASTEEIEGIKEDAQKDLRPAKKGFFEKLKALFRRGKNRN